MRPTTFGRYFDVFSALISEPGAVRAEGINVVVGICIAALLWLPIRNSFSGIWRSVARSALIVFLFMPCGLAVGHGGGVVPSTAFWMFSSLFGGFRDPRIFGILFIESVFSTFVPFVILTLVFEAWRRHVSEVGNGKGGSTTAERPPVHISRGWKLIALGLLGLGLMALYVLPNW